jgi:hypothetical protein
MKNYTTTYIDQRRLGANSRINQTGAERITRRGLVNHRNPKCSSFIEACEDDDEAIFVEQVSHAELPCSGFRSR